MKISFDFDGTLSEDKYQKLAAKFIQLGAEVFITTSRNPNNNNMDLFNVAKKLGIKEAKITFTNFMPKTNFVKKYDIHFDDDDEEIYDINLHPCDCLAIQC